MDDTEWRRRDADAAGRSREMKQRNPIRIAILSGALVACGATAAEPSSLPDGATENTPDQSAVSPDSGAQDATARSDSANSDGGPTSGDAGLAMAGVLA